MQISVARIFAAAALFLLAGLGCSQNSQSSKKFLLPVLNSQGVTELREVTLDTLSDPSEVSGAAATVYYNPSLTTSGFAGRAAQTRLTRAGDLYVPKDVATSSSLSIYHSFEMLYKFDQRVLPDFPMAWPRRVGLDLRFAQMGGFAANNAFYLGSLDLTAILPFSLQGLPLSYNVGVLAHEHFHAHFLRLMGSALELPQSVLDPHGYQTMGARCGLDHINKYASTSDPEFRSVVNYFVLRGWNEGLADLYSVLVTGNDEFFDVSFKSDHSRKLSEPAGDVFSRVQMENSVTADLFGSSDERCFTLENSYTLGTQIARTLFHKIQNGDFDGFEKSQNWTRSERSLRLIFKSIRQVNSQIQAQTRTGKLDPIWIVDQIQP